MSATLETLLLRDGILDPERVALAVEDAKRTYKSLAETVIDLGFIEERRLAEWIASVSGTRLVDPLPDDVPVKLERRLPPATARLRMVVPVGEESGSLCVAMVNPLDETTLQVLRSTSGSEILPVTGVRSAVERLVNRVYPEQLDGDATVMPNVRFTFSLDEPSGAPAPIPVAAQPPAPLAEDEPFDFSNRTLLASPPGLEAFTDEPPPPAPSHDGRFGTLIAEPLPGSAIAEPPPTTPAPPEALARIEQRLDTIAGAIERLQRRLDALDMTLMRFMNR